ncbi:MAG TPA: ABC transporter permease [Gaiellaceae bacterium]|nr:ABC transporter permease [Gaiellaceae bacterium]
MSFAGLIVKNLFRQRVRTGLTVLGIAIGITTVVALGVITAGFKEASGAFVQAGGADFAVAQKGASDLTFSAVSDEDRRAIAARPDVARATGFLLDVADVGGNPYFFVFGYDPADLADEPLELVDGRLLAPGAPDEAVLGIEAAADLKKGVGDAVTLDGTRFRVVGVARFDDDWRSAGALAPLATVQANASKRDVVTAVHVTAAQGLDPREVAAAIERDLPELAAIVDVADYAEVDQGFKIMDAAELAISLLAVGIGAIGVMNTMIMSVFERTREIGVLRAVGWRGSRILRMILYESLFLCLVAAVIGIALGLLASRAVLFVPAVSTFLTPGYPPEVFVRALAVGVVVALAGAVYPAARAVRLSPMEALRHE